MDSKKSSWFSEHMGPLIVAIISLVLILYFLSPFIDGLILGTVFAYVGRPVRDLFKTRRKLGALAASLSIIVPLFLIFGLAMLEIANQILNIAQNQEVIRSAFYNIIIGLEIPEFVGKGLAGNLQNIMEIVAPLVSSIHVLSIGRTVSLALFNLLISIVVCYFLLLDGERFIESVMSLMPLEKIEIYRRYIERIDGILSGIFIATIYTSLLGSFLAALVFYAFGVPRPFTAACFVFIAGMIPIFTAWMVLLPVALYRFFTIGLSDALIFFAVSACFIYLPSELLIRPYLVSVKSSIHPLLVMLSFIGGGIMAGISGFFLAPAVMGIIVGLYQVRREELAALRMGE
ncbi:MAG: AI-2E family transporter [Methanotrichaceae archaeon]|nr:AI-2E family transporter [Methanotrichaceae archaeon]